MSLLKIISMGLLFVAVMAVSAASAATCTLASVSGVYGFLNAGQDAAGQPYAGLGQVTADGKGNLTSLTVTNSHNGTITTGTITSGATYTMAKNLRSFRKESDLRIESDGHADWHW
jgi:hypothetical protein